MVETHSLVLKGQLDQKGTAENKGFKGFRAKKVALVRQDAPANKGAPERGVVGARKGSKACKGVDHVVHKAVVAKVVKVAVAVLDLMDHKGFKAHRVFADSKETVSMVLKDRADVPESKGVKAIAESAGFAVVKDFKVCKGVGHAAHRVVAAKVARVVAAALGLKDLLVPGFKARRDHGGLKGSKGKE